jgi:hypothetical protein
MATDVIVTVGAGGTYANLAAARTALGSLNLVSLDQRYIVKLMEDQVLTNTSSTFSNPNTDATRYIHVIPDDGLSWDDLAGSSVYYPPTAGLKLTVTSGAAGALSIERGWFFDLLRIEATPTVAGISPIRIGSTSTAKYTGISRCWITGDHTLASLLDLRDASITTEPTQAFLLDSVVIGSGTDASVGVITGTGGAIYRNTIVAAGGAGRALRLQVTAANRGFWVIDNALVGSWETVHTAANLGAASSSNSRGNYLTGAYVQTGTGTTYTSASWTTGATAASLFENIASNLRPRSTSALLGGATGRSDNMPDVNGNNRGLNPDIGAIQRTSAPPLAAGTFTTGAVSGQTASFAGTVSNAASGSLTLTGTSTVGPIAIVISGGTWSIPDIINLLTGTYTASLLLLNSQGATTGVGGPTLVVDSYIGSPEGPEQTEVADPPVVSNVVGLPTAPTTAKISLDTTRSGGTAWVVITGVTTKPTKTQIKAGQTNTGAAVVAGRKLSQAVTTPGTRDLNASSLTASGNFYAHAFHEHPDGDSEVVSSPVFTQPAVVAPPSITDQPDSTTVNDGDNAVFSVSFTGTSPTVQARRDGANIPGAVVGAGTASLTISDCTVDDNGAEITFHLSNAAGSVTSSPAVLTVTAPVAAPTIITEPADDAVIKGEAAGFSFEATNGGGTNVVQWFTRPKGNTGNGTAVPGATSTSLTTSSLAVADDGREYRAQVTNQAATIYTRWAAVSVQAVLAPPVMPGEITFSEVSHQGFRATWPAAVGVVTRYEVAIDGDAWVSNSTLLTRYFPGAPLTTYDLDVRAINVDVASNVLSKEVTLPAAPPVLPPGTGGVIAGISPSSFFQLLAMAGES